MDIRSFRQTARAWIDAHAEEMIADLQAFTRIRSVSRADLAASSHTLTCGAVHVRFDPGNNPANDEVWVGTGEPGEITRVVQRAFDDALRGRSERYAEWLDVVPAPAPAT